MSVCERFIATFNKADFKTQVVFSRRPLRLNFNDYTCLHSAAPGPTLGLPSFHIR